MGTGTVPTALDLEEGLEFLAALNGGRNVDGRVAHADEHDLRPDA
jgi:hypothetical protein